MGVILGCLGVIALGLLGRWLGTELGVWHKPLCRWLVRVAAARLPREERAPVQSEWLAVIEDLRSPTAQLLHAASYLFSSLRIRQSMAPRRQPHRLVIFFSISVIGVLSVAAGMGGALLAHPRSSRQTIVLIIAMLLVAVVGLGVGYRAKQMQRMLDARSELDSGGE
jgi:hypothetical protein